MNSSTSPNTIQIQCRLCSKPIKFDDNHVSHRSGRKIPLDADTEQPHKCSVWLNSQPYQSQQPYEQSLQQQQHHQQPQQQRTAIRYRPCNKRCGSEIYFDANNKSQSGKFIPLDRETGLPHNCV